MRQILRGHVVKLLLALGFAPLLLLPPALYEWAQICAGGQANPAFHSAECKDLGTLFALILRLCLVAVAPAVTFLLLRSIWRGRAQK